MYQMKKPLKIIGKTLLVFIGLILLYLLSAFGLSRITVNKEANTKEEVTIYINTNGVHTDIVVPTVHEQINWSQEVKFSNIGSKDTTYAYLAFGWGDKGFYLQTPNWSDLKASVAFKATFGLSSTAIHATYYSSMIESETCKKIMISKDQYARLIKYILESFRKNAEGHFINIKTNANYGNSDAFYEAKGRYNLFFTCNTWTNKGLKKCGQKACFWTVLDKGIFYVYGK